MCAMENTGLSNLRCWRWCSPMRNVVSSMQPLGSLSTYQASTAGPGQYSACVCCGLEILMWRNILQMSNDERETRWRLLIDVLIFNNNMMQSFRIKDQQYASLKDGHEHCWCSSLYDQENCSPLGGWYTSRPARSHLWDGRGMARRHGSVTGPCCLSLTDDVSAQKPQTGNPATHLWASTVEWGRVCYPEVMAKHSFVPASTVAEESPPAQPIGWRDQRETSCSGRAELRVRNRT